MYLSSSFHFRNRFGNLRRKPSHRNKFKQNSAQKRSREQRDEREWRQAHVRVAAGHIQNAREQRPAKEYLAFLKSGGEGLYDDIERDSLPVLGLFLKWKSARGDCDLLRHSFSFPSLFPKFVGWFSKKKAMD